VTYAHFLRFCRIDILATIVALVNSWIRAFPELLKLSGAPADVHPGDEGGAGPGTRGLLEQAEAPPSWNTLDAR
jgi:hypothetical protein